MADQSTGSDLERRLEAAANRIDARARGYETGAVIAVVLAIALAVFWFLYFGRYTYKKVEEMAKPDMVANYLQSMIDAKKDDVKRMAIEAIKERVEPLADSVADKLCERIPAVRVDLEKRAVKLARKGVDELLTRGDKMMRDTIAKHEGWIASSLTQIKTPEDAAKFQRELAQKLTEQLGPSFKEKVQAFGRDMADAGTELERLRVGKGLTTDERTMREILMYVKFLERRKGFFDLPKIGDMEQVQEDVVKLGEGAKRAPKGAARGGRGPSTRPAGAGGPRGLPAARKAPPAAKK